jgi:hypothetical protein
MAKKKSIRLLSSRAASGQAGPAEADAIIASLRSQPAQIEAQVVDAIGHG